MMRNMYLLLFINKCCKLGSSDVVCLLGAEGTQRMKAPSSNVSSAPASAQSMVESSVAKSASTETSQYHKTDPASSSAHIHASLPRPIRPTQVEPSTPDHSSSTTARQAKPVPLMQVQPQHQATALRPPMNNAAQAPRRFLLTVISCFAVLAVCSMWV